MQITGLPFTVGATTNAGFIIGGYFASSYSTARDVFLGLEASDTNGKLYYKVGDGTNVFHGGHTGNSFSMTFSGTYRTDA